MNGSQLLRALADRAGRPFGVHLQVADRCNHACGHCYQVQGEKGELDLDALRGIIDGIAEAGVLTLNVSGGEATLRPDLPAVLRHARSRGMAVRLYTNAFLVDRAYAAELASIGLLEVHVSVYSAAPTEHDAVTKVPGSFVRTVDGVRAMRAHGMRVVLKTPATRLSVGGSAGVADLAAELGCTHHPSNDLTAREDGSTEPWDLRVSPEELLRPGRLTPWAPADDAGERRREKLAVSPCGVGRSGLVVLPDGRLQPCTDTPRTAADLTQTPLAEALRSPELRLFEGLDWSKVHGCRDCDLLSACHRCHATALHERGDYLGPYAAACARAAARYAASVGPLEVLAPAEGVGPGRDPSVGPFAIVRRGVIQPVADVRTAADEALAAAFPWIRGSSVDVAAPSALVPLRRGASGGALAMAPPGRAGVQPPDGPC